MAFPVCSQLLLFPFWHRCVTEAKLISLLKTYRGCSRQDNCSEGNPCLQSSQPCWAYDDCLTPTTMTSHRLFEINRYHLWRPWKTRSVSTLGYLNRAVIWVAIIFPAAKLWKSSKVASCSCRRQLTLAWSAALLFPLKPPITSQLFWKAPVRYVHRFCLLTLKEV